jgi:hypothetical protein
MLLNSGVFLMFDDEDREIINIGGWILVGYLLGILVAGLINKYGW